MKKSLFILVAVVLIVGCKTDDYQPETKKEPEQLAKIDKISLDSKSYSKTISLSRDLQKENATLELKNKSFWISNLKINANKISFDVLENIYFDKGFRFDTVLVLVEKTVIGKIAVAQARNRVTDKRLIWANETALYRNIELPLKSYSGLELTKYVYNLGKTTNGKDSYKNYPAFAYCIDMNIDPANNMEWYLPSIVDMQEVHSRVYNFFSLYVYWWTATDTESYVIPHSDTNGTTKFSKSDDYWIYSFRVGSKEQ